MSNQGGIGGNPRDRDLELILIGKHEKPTFARGWDAVHNAGFCSYSRIRPWDCYRVLLAVDARFYAQV